VLGSLLAPTTDMSAEDRLARENLVTSLVAGIAAASGTNAATATGAGQIEGALGDVTNWLRRSDCGSLAFGYCANFASLS